MMSRWIFIPIAGLSFIFFISCESEKREEFKPENIADSLSFATDIGSIFEAKCISCHNGKIPPNLTSENAFIELTGGGYTDVDDPENSVIIKVISEGGSMKEYANEQDRAYILKWIELGTQDN